MARLTLDQRTTNAVARPNEFGVLLRQFRASAGLTQVELAERASMSWRGIADLERGIRRAPYPSTVRRLADALALTPGDRVRFMSSTGRGSASVNVPLLRTAGIHPPLSSFIGREREIEHIRELFTETRLLTLTGPPGVGKTRLAYELAHTRIAEFADGAASIELAPVTDPSLVPHSVADSLGVREVPGQTMTATLEDALRDSQVLVVLDNCEHLLLACAALVDRLLRACPEMRVLATSRAALRVPGEVVMEVPPLSVLNPEGMPGASDAVRLFVERCKAQTPGFVLGADELDTVRDVCTRLDGVPLALELAAGRIRALGLDEVSRRLDDRFRLLTGGSRTAAPHQQTLLATLEWSYGLLSDQERRVLDAMSVFVGGADSSAVASVCAPVNGSDPIDIVSGLIEQSLVTVERSIDGQVRYGMLESVREFARQQLSESDEEDVIRLRHAEVFYKAILGEGLPPSGAEDAGWLARFEREHANVRAALRWLVDTRQIEQALRLAVACSRYWDVRGHVVEGRQWLDEILALAVGRADTTYLEAVMAAAQLARRDDDYQAVEHLVQLGLGVADQVGDAAAAAGLLTTQATAQGFRGEVAAAQPLHERALAIWRQLGDRVGMATSLNNLAIVYDQLGDREAARAALIECIRLARHVAPGRTLASALNNLGLLLHRMGRNTEARPSVEESLTIAREHRDTYATANALGSLGLVVHELGELEAARRMFEESLAIRREGGDRRGVAISMQNLAAVLVDLRELEQAEVMLEESLSIFNDLHSSWGVADALETQACLAAARSEAVDELLAEAEEIRQRLGIARPARLQAQLDRWIGPGPHEGQWAR